MSEVKDKLFKFGEDVKNSAGKLAKGAVDGTKKVAEKAKIKNTMSHAESKLNALYMEIGKKYEELYAEQGDANFAEQLAQIAEVREELAQARVELAALDSASICSCCGKYVLEGQRFCPCCGTKAPEPPVEEELVEAAEEEAAETAETEAPAEDAE